MEEEELVMKGDEGGDGADFRGNEGSGDKGGEIGKEGISEDK